MPNPRLICPACRYDRSGTPNLPCPEYGSTRPPGLDRRARRAWMHRWVRLGAFLATGVLWALLVTAGIELSPRAFQTQRFWNLAGIGCFVGVGVLLLEAVELSLRIGDDRGSQLRARAAAVVTWSATAAGLVTIVLVLSGL
ncbi:MAG: hypothetical protein K2Q20_11445 [Phycisphaerales bacterium]|nr:hypothetical protein [Phycisphaerales bacterium]